jgi:NADH:ubiquinone oxidoreductase subunit 4 (subunit M)
MMVGVVMISGDGGPHPGERVPDAAAMVKAGIYLVARLAPGFADSAGWMPFLVTFGIWTMLVGASRALRQYDLKLVLAYGTVSQLGFFMIVVGFGTGDAALAGVALLIAHALYKAALFPVVRSRLNRHRNQPSRIDAVPARFEHARRGRGGMLPAVAAGHGATPGECDRLT